MRRIRRTGQDVPLVVAYDKNERIYNPPMPLLFQWPRRLEDRPVSETSLRGYLDHALAAIGAKAPRPRRCATPSTISAGSSSPTRSCTACRRTSPSSSPGTATSTPPWATRPSTPRKSSTATAHSSPAAALLRPAADTASPPTRNGPSSSATSNAARSPSDDCGRSYDTPCIHEHACLRCPLLRPDPAQRSRLAQICGNLTARIAEAEANPTGSAKPRA